MGKTYREVFAGSCSVDYHSEHNRGFAKKKKRNSHHSIRNKNKNKDESEYDNFNCKSVTKMNTHWAASYGGDIGNVGNMPNTNIKDLCCNKKWKKDDLSNENFLEKIFEEEKCGTDAGYLRATLKQIKRRGKATLFKGHNKLNYLKDIII